MKTANSLIVGIAQICLVIGVYLTLLLKSTLGLLVLGVALVLFISYYHFKGKELTTDEMLKKVSGEASNFSFMMTLASIALLSVFSIRYPLFSDVDVLLIVFTVLIISKMMHQAYWYFSAMRHR